MLSEALGLAAPAKLQKTSSKNGFPTKSDMILTASPLHNAWKHSNMMLKSGKGPGFIGCVDQHVKLNKKVASSALRVWKTQELSASGCSQTLKAQFETCLLWPHQLFEILDSGSSMKMIGLEAKKQE